MAEKKHSHKKSYYNDIALQLGHQLFGVEHLHYGYFEKGKKPTMQNLPAAQEAYVRNLLKYIPAGVKRVFDVGCGSGGVAVHLVKKKLDVTCLAPDPYLIEKTLENTGGKVGTITDLYENLNPEESGLAPFDMILMSESCQYIKVAEGWEQNRRFLKSKGYVLVADFFRIKELDRPGLSKSGHPLDYFLEQAEEHGFKLKKKVDITKFVAPTMDLYQETITEKIFPVFGAIFEIVQRRYPMIYRLLRWMLGKKIQKLHLKYSNQGSEVFTNYKAYMVMLFQKAS
ncbi:MAG: methyltransferase [Leptospiraceae bacterium]|nr:methyltransferase [Leptospiraceae bacterium]